MYGYGYGQPPGYLQQNNAYTPLMQYQPQQQQSQMPSINPMSFINRGGSAGSSAAPSGGSGGGAMGSLGPIAAIMAAVALSKGVEYRNSDNMLGKLGQTFNAPSINQIREDPKVGLTTALGIPFVNSFIMNKKAKKAQPEWEQMFGIGR